MPSPTLLLPGVQSQQRKWLLLWSLAGQSLPHKARSEGAWSQPMTARAGPRWLRPCLLLLCEAKVLGLELVAGLDRADPTPGRPAQNACRQKRQTDQAPGSQRCSRKRPLVHVKIFGRKMESCTLSESPSHFLVLISLMWS